MSSSRVRNILPPLLALGTIVFVLVGHPWADPDGRPGVAQRSNGCSCHNADASQGVTVTIQGPNGVAPGSVNDYTIMVSGAPAGSQGGFDLQTTAGTFLPGTGSRVSQGDLVHSNANSRTWNFQWTAPMTEGPVQWYAVGLAADGSGTEDGDQWNFYGAAVGTPFTIQVNSLIGVEGHGVRRLELGPATPNPSRGPMTAAYRLPRACAVDACILDAHGRTIRRLDEPSRPAGAHSLVWDGCGANGMPVPAGVYFMRLRAGGETRTMRFVRVD